MSYSINSMFPLSMLYFFLEVFHPILLSSVNKDFGIARDSFSLRTVKLGYNELGYNKHSSLTNKYFGPKCTFTTQIDSVIMNPGYNKRIWLVLRYSL